MDRRAQVRDHFFKFSVSHILVHFLRSRKGDGTLRSRSRNEGRQSLRETRRGSRGWKHRGGAAGATSSLLSEALLPDSSSPGWTQPQAIGEVGGEIFFRIASLDFKD